MSRERFLIFVSKTALLFFTLAAIICSPVFAEEKPIIVFLGDSLTAGLGVEAGSGYPDLLQSALSDKGYKITITNAGVSGDTTSGGLARLDWSIPEEAQGVVLALGANDALRGIPVERTRQNLEAMLVRLKERNIPVLLAGMLSPPSMGQAYETQFNAIYSKLAEKYKPTFYPFLLDGVAAEPDLNQADGIHPNEKGMAVISERMLPAMESFVQGLVERRSD